MTAAVVIRGDAAHIPMPDASVDLIVTSPPYYALRSYTDGGVHYPGQIGSEATPADYIDALIDCTAEWMRVLKPSGSMFVDLGDKYGRPGGGADRNPRSLDGAGRSTTARLATASDGGGRDKCLMLLPERYRIAAVDRLGLIARAVIIWAKPNGLPESVTDRVRRSHEDWVHLVRQPRYYSAVDEIREPHTGGTHPRRADGTLSPKEQATVDAGHRRGYFPDHTFNPLGKLPGSVWSIEEDLWDHVLSGPMRFCPRCGRDLAAGSSQAANAADSESAACVCELGLLPTGLGSVWSVPSEPLQVPAHLGIDHFAAFPSEWCRRLILGWSPPGICTACGEGRRPVAAGGGYAPEALARRGTASQEYSYRTASGKPSPLLSVNLSGPEKERYRIPHTITGYVCACTPYTDHPGTGTGGGWGSYDDAGRSGGPAANGKQHVPANYQPRHGPRREYHPEAWIPPPTRPAVVLDPFGGTGTTALVASVLGRIGITVDRSADYSRLAAWRTTNPGERARALRVPKPEPVADAQLTLDWEVA